MTSTLPARPQTVADGDFKVADLSLAAFGRKEIQLAEHEMPGPDGDPAGVRAGAAAARRADHRLAAHDDPDRGAHRDAGRARRRGALGVLQHLLHPGPRRRRGRGRPDRHGRRAGRRAGLRLEGRDAAGVLVVHRAGAALAGRRRPQHDPRRRWRRDAARAQGQGVRGRRRGPGHRRHRLRGVRRHPRRAAPLADRGRAAVDHGRRRHQGRHRGDHDRRAPALRDGATRARCCSRRSTSTTRSPSPSSTTSTAAGTR